MMHMNGGSSSSSEENDISPYERAFRLIQEAKDELSSEEDERGVMSSENDEDKGFDKGESSEEEHSYRANGFITNAIPLTSMDRHYGSNRHEQLFPDTLQLHLPNETSMDLQRSELDRLILSIIKKEEKSSNGVSDLRIKERLLESGPNNLVQWALEKIPGPVGMYGYTSLLQKTTEMHLGIRRLLEEERITKKTKRTYVSVAGRGTSHSGSSRKRHSQPTPTLFPQESYFQPIEEIKETGDQVMSYGDAEILDGNRRSKRKRKEPKLVEDDIIPIKYKKPKKPVIQSFRPLIWPSAIEYTSKVINGGNLSKDVKKRMAEAASNFVSEFVRIGVVDSPQRAAVGEWGLFAVQDIEASKVLGEYAGKLRLADKDKRRGSCNYLSIHYDDSRFCVDVDSQQAGNEFRYINDIKDSGKTKANIKFETVPIGGEWHILVVTKEKISKGEELVADFSQYRLEPIKQEIKHEVKQEVQYFNGYQVEQCHFIPHEDSHVQHTIPSGALFEGVHSARNILTLV